jgi:di/tricarboxylate transporter
MGIFRDRAVEFGQIQTAFRFWLMAIAGVLPVLLVGGTIWLWTKGTASPGDIAAAGAIAIRIAQGMDASIDPFLMAITIGASCAFLTPIGHQNNALILGPGGFRFGDYWRMGLPLEIIVVAAATPMLLWVWPL